MLWVPSRCGVLELAVRLCRLLGAGDSTTAGVGTGKQEGGDGGTFALSETSPGEHPW